VVGFPNARVNRRLARLITTTASTANIKKGIAERLSSVTLPFKVREYENSNSIPEQLRIARSKRAGLPWLHKYYRQEPHNTEACNITKGLATFSAKPFDRTAVTVSDGALYIVAEFFR
jgi:hypothetical protein